MKDANLSGADLSRAVLIYANLIYANLSGANLIGAVLSRAVLSGTDLRGARAWTNKQLAQARSLVGAVLPDGTEMTEEAWEAFKKR